MKFHWKKLFTLSLTVVLTVFAISGCSNTTETAQETAQESAADTEAAAVAKEEEETEPETVQAEESKIPKYIFLFIGDGLSYPQIQSTAYYLGAAANSDEITNQELSFMDFPVAGSAQTWDSTSFCPDSASTATSIASGHKTYSGTINMDTTQTIKYETIAEQLKKQLGYKIGVISTVNLNHATPAAFYAHQASRDSYYEIGLELVDSDFDFFAGGALKKNTGDNKDKEDLYELADKAGYKVIKSQEEANALTAGDGKALIISEALADSDAMSYNLDAADGEWVLSDYVKKGIDVLHNDTGFFMMIEGGKIDWACHANDAGSTISDTLALDTAVREAFRFYNEHPDDTLILVTGDHETGGLTIGFAGTNYDTYLTNLSNQVISYAKYDSDYVASYKENKTPFEDVLKDIKACFGLMTAEDPDAEANPTLVLTGYEMQSLEDAYTRSMEVGASGQEDMTQEEYILYGTYEPLSVTVTHILNNKSGIAFTSYSHTGNPVPVYAIGNGSELFEGYYDNTDIYKSLAKITGVKSGS